MKLSTVKNIILSVIFTSLCLPDNISAQEIIEIDPIFEYPVAPEEIESITEKSDYLVKHFWDQLDFKSTAPLNQIALNDAFRVYLTPVRFAPEKSALQSLETLLNNISGNPTLLVQFIKAAEENLYGPRAEIWSDEIYLKFLDAGIKNKKVSQTRKDKYRQRAALLRANATGNSPQSFQFEDASGKQETYIPMSTPTILVFGDPEDTDWRLSRLKLDTNTPFAQALEKGKINIIYISLNENEGWKDAVSTYPKYWITGICPGITDVYDIRVLPSLYLIGSDGKIIMKNAPLGQVVAKALELVN